MSESVIVGMSGGVDSAVAAYLLKEKGYKVTGCTLKFAQENNKCCKIDDARIVADKIGIDFLTRDVSSEFKQKIINEFVLKYSLGLTPNPCPPCNVIKFKDLLEIAEKNNISYIASGHYARIINDKLYSAKNLKKDQSYFLSRLSENLLRKIKLPLGSYTKNTIRQIAQKINMHVAEKKDSQDICFVDKDYRTFLKNQGIKDKKGKVVDINGRVFAEHKGIHNYTIGQRFRYPGLPERKYILKTDINKNQIVIGTKDQLHSTKLQGKKLHILDNASINKPLLFKVRYRDGFFPGRLIHDYSGRYSVDFEKPVDAITPGQLCVAYLKDEIGYRVVASGWIT